MDILEFGVLVRDEWFRSPAPLLHGFAEDWRNKRIKVADRIIPNFPTLMTSEVRVIGWMVIDLTMCEGDAAPQYNFEEGQFPPRTISNEQLLGLLADYCSALTSFSAATPEETEYEGETNTFGAILIIELYGRIEVIGLYPANLSEVAARQVHQDALLHRFRDLAKLIEQVSAVETQASASRSTEEPSAVNGAQVPVAVMESLTSPGNVFQRLAYGLSEFGLPPSEDLPLTQGLGQMMPQHMKTLRSTPGAPSVWKLSTEWDITTIYIVVGWECNTGDCGHTALLHFQANDFIELDDWVHKLTGLKDLWVAATQGRELYGHPDAEIPSGPLFAWVVVQSGEEKDGEFQYFLLRKDLKPEIGLAAFMEEFGEHHNIPLQ